MKKEKFYLIMSFLILIFLTIYIIQIFVWNKRNNFNIKKNYKKENEFKKHFWFKLNEKRPLTKKSLNSLNPIKKILLTNDKKITIDSFISNYFPKLKNYFKLNKKLNDIYLNLKKPIYLIIKITSFKLVKRENLDKKFLKKIFKNENLINLIIKLMKNKNFNKNEIQNKISYFLNEQNINKEEILKKISDHILF